ncbi:MAG: hypothetical protein EBR82_24815 [Caulobacteraceae bacterium]|nr:hypothetical protein [Caulobacteraceae bacterium]
MDYSMHLQLISDIHHPVFQEYRVQFVELYKQSKFLYIVCEQILEVMLFESKHYSQRFLDLWLDLQ